MSAAPFNNVEVLTVRTEQLGEAEECYDIINIQMVLLVSNLISNT